MAIIVNPARLRVKMDERGYSNSALAESATVSEGTVKRLIRGETTTRTTVSLIALALDTTVEWLTDPTDPPTVSTLSESYLAQIVELQRRVEDLKALYYHERTERQKTLVFTLILVIFICLILTVDILNPQIGWVRAA